MILCDFNISIMMIHRDFIISIVMIIPDFITSIMVMTFCYQHLHDSL